MHSRQQRTCKTDGEAMYRVLCLFNGTLAFAQIKTTVVCYGALFNNFRPLQYVVLLLFYVVVLDNRSVDFNSVTILSYWKKCFWIQYS